MARYDDLNTKMIGYAAVLSAVVLVIILQCTQALCYNMVNSVSRDREGSEADVPTKAKKEQLDSLTGYQKKTVLDDAAPPPEKGKEPATKEVIYIPIKDAQQKLLKELNATGSTGA